MPLRAGTSSGLFMVMLAAGLWATVGVAVELTPGAGDVSDTVLAALRTGIAGPVLIALWGLSKRPRSTDLSALALRPLCLFALSSAVFQICLFRSFDQLGVTVAVFLTVCLPPVLAWAWAGLRHRRAVSGQAAMALGLAVVGMAVISVARFDAGSAQLSLSGLAHGVIASIAFVVMSLAAADLSRRASPLLVAGSGLSLSALLLFGTALVLGEGWQLHQSLGGSAAQIGLLVLYLGLLPTALAYLCYCAGMARCRTPVTGLMASMIEPLLAAGLVSLLLGERISTVTAGGCVLLMGAMVLLWHCESKPAGPSLPAHRHHPVLGTS